MKTKITHDEYLKLLGIAAIVEQHDDALDSAHYAAAKLLDLHDDAPLDDFYGTHAYDALHGSRSMRQALLLMGVAIEPPAPRPKPARYSAATARAVRLAKQVEAGTATPSAATEGLDSEELSAAWKDAVLDLHAQLAERAEDPDA